MTERVGNLLSDPDCGINELPEENKQESVLYSEMFVFFNAFVMFCMI